MTLAHSGRQHLTLGHRGQRKNCRTMKNARRVRLVKEDDTAFGSAAVMVTRQNGRVDTP